MPKRLSISHDRAFADYLMLGGERSLRQLHRMYVGITANPPSVDTLTAWSAKHRWQERMAAHEDQVRQQFMELAAKDTAQAQWDAVAACRSNARAILDTMAQKIASAAVGNGNDVRAMVEAAVTLLRTGEVLSGGVSERVEQIQQTLTPEEARKRAEEHIHDAFAALAAPDAR